MSESIPDDSSKPCTTSASDSCSVSNTRTSFSLGLGRTAGPSFIVPLITADGLRIRPAAIFNPQLYPHFR